MANTKYYIADQVFLYLNGGSHNASATVQMEDILAVLGQKANALIKAKHFDETLSSGETIPDNLVIATYNNVPISTFHGKRSVATLPATPVYLPRNMGVYLVDKYEDFRNPFIPVRLGQYALLSKQPLINDLLDQVGYEVDGNRLITTKDITIDGTTEIFIKLVVLDLEQYDDNTPLPLPADYEDLLVQSLIKHFMPEPKAMKIVDPTTDLLTANPQGK